MHDISELPIVNFNDSMGKTLITMTIKGFGCVGVVNKSKKLVGIITDGDLRRNIKKDLINKKSSDVMTKNPQLVSEKTLVCEALNIMNSKKITSLFVCINSQPIGIIHIHDLLRLST